MRLFIFIASVTVCLTVACSRTLPVLNKKTAVPKEQGIFIIGVDWIETYNDLEKKEDFRRVGSVFYNLREDDIEKNKTEKKDDKTQIPPLHLFSFRLSIEGSDLENKELLFYSAAEKFKKFQAYALPPQDIYIEYIYFTGTLLNVNSDNGLNERQAKNIFKLTLPKPINAELNAGKMVYLGTVKIYINTKHVWFGLFPREEVNKSMKVIGYEIADEFDEMKTYFQNNDDWLPVNIAENISVPVMYKRTFHNWEITDKDFLMGVEKERDKSKFFY